MNLSDKSLFKKKNKKTEQLWSRTPVTFVAFSFLNMTTDHNSHLKRCYHYPPPIVDIEDSCKGTSTGQKEGGTLMLYQHKSEEECYSLCTEHKAAGRKPAFHILLLWFPFWGSVLSVLSLMLAFISWLFPIPDKDFSNCTSNETVA